MSRNEINDIINQRKSSLSRLNKLFHTIDLFKGTNQNEYHRLSEKVLVQLEKGVDYNKMKEVLEYPIFSESAITSVKLPKHTKPAFW